MEFNPKSARAQGDVVFKSPARDRIFVSWGDLSKVEKLKGVEGHADYSIEKIRKSREAEIKDIRKDSRLVNGHRASYRDLRMEMLKRGVFFNKTKTPQVVRSLHLHCDISSRYFVIYGPVVPERAEGQEEILSRMIRSFVCHGQ